MVSEYSSCLLGEFNCSIICLQKRLIEKSSLISLLCFFIKDKTFAVSQKGRCRLCFVIHLTKDQKRLVLNKKRSFQIGGIVLLFFILINKRFNLTSYLFELVLIIGAATFLLQFSLCF